MKELQTALGALKHESDSGMLYRARVGLEALPPKSAPPPAPGAAKSAPSPMILGLVAALVIVSVAGAGTWWWMKHRKVAEPTAPPTVVVTPPPAPIAEAPPPAPAPPADQTLTNDSIIQLVEGKVATGVILSQIRSAEKTSFNLSTAEVLRLTKAGVSDAVIETMRNPKRQVARSAPAPAPAPTPAPVPVASVTPPEPVAAPEPAPAPRLRLPPEITQTVTLVDGSPITVTLSEDIPDNADAGRPLHFTVTNDVRMEGSIVFAKGAPVTGEIVEGAKKKLFGGTKMTLRLLAIEAADGRKYRIRAVSARGGGDAKNQRPVETNVKPKSKDVTASAGTGYIAYIDGDVTITVRK
jgi:hypothetical protein